MKTTHVQSFFHDAVILTAVCAAAFVVYLTTPRSKRTTQSWGSYTYVKTDNGFSLYTDRPNTYFLFTSDTITYGRNDIVYDEAGNLFTENPDILRHMVEEKTGVPLLHSDPTIRTISQTASAITLINPDVSGAIRIDVPKNTPITVNKDMRTILVHEAIQVSVLPIL